MWGYLRKEAYVPRSPLGLEEQRVQTLDMGSIPAQLFANCANFIFSNFNFFFCKIMLISQGWVEAR